MAQEEREQEKQTTDKKALCYCIPNLQKLVSSGTVWRDYCQYMYIFINVSVNCLLLDFVGYSLATSHITFTYTLVHCQ